MSIRRTIISLLVIGGAAAAVYLLRNPERRDLDAAAREAAPGRFVQLGDGLTHFEVSGPDSGSRVVLVHGFSVPMYIWDSTVTGLTAAGFRVARYDLLGRGYSERPDVPYTVDLFDRQLSQFLDSLGWREPVDVVGLSMGGVVTGAFTGRHPERVRSLTLVDPAAGPSGDVAAQFRIPGLGPFLWQVLAVPGMAEGQLGDFAEPARWPGWPDRYRTQMQYRGFGRALRSTIRSQASLDLDTLYARVGTSGVPVLLVWGKEDQVVPFRYSADVRRAIPGARFLPVDGAGHLPHMEQTATVNSVLISFLQNPATQ